MPTRIISWQQLVLENDPNWIRDSLNPPVWEFSNGRIFVDPAAPYAPLPDSGLTNDNGFIVTDGAVTDIPTADPLKINELFSNNGFVCISSKGNIYQVGLSIFWPTTLDQLLLIGGGALPTFQPFAGSSQLYLNGGFVCVA